jgi:hypothetical protein
MIPQKAAGFHIAPIGETPGARSMRNPLVVAAVVKVTVPTAPTSERDALTRVFAKLDRGAKWKAVSYPFA